MLTPASAYWWWSVGAYRRTTVVPIAIRRQVENIHIRINSEAIPKNVPFYEGRLRGHFRSLKCAAFSPKASNFGGLASRFCFKIP